MAQTCMSYSPLGIYQSSVRSSDACCTLKLSPFPSLKDSGKLNFYKREHFIFQTLQSFHV